MKIIKKTMAVLFALIIMLQFVMIPSYAKSSGSLSLSASSLSIGKTLTVTVTFSNSPNPIGAVEGYLTFNSSVLDYVPSTNSSLASGSKVKMIGVGDGSSNSITFSVKFTCKAAGSSSLSLSGSVLDYDTEKSASVSASRSVTVTGSSSLSNDATLKSLVGSYGSFSPKFSSKVTSYSITIPNNVTTYTITATPTNSKAKTEYFGSMNMQVGKNTRSVVVTAEDGVTKKTYTVTVTRKEGAASSQKPSTSSGISSSEAVSSEMTNEFSIGENKYTVLDEWQADTKLPAGFEATEYLLNEKTIAALKSSGGTILVYSADQSGNKSFVIYDEENNEYSAFHALEYEEKSYMLTERDRTAPVPTDFYPVKKNIGGEMTDTWTNEKGETLIYATDTDGKCGFFLYDETSGKIEFFSFEPDTESTPSSSVKEQKGWLENLKEDNETLFKIVVIETGIIVILFIILIVLLCLYLNKKNRDNNDDGYYDEPFDDFGDEDFNGVISDDFNGVISDDFKELFDVIE